MRYKMVIFILQFFNLRKLVEALLNNHSLMSRILCSVDSVSLRDLSERLASERTLRSSASSSHGTQSDWLKLIEVSDDGISVNPLRKEKP